MNKKAVSILVCLLLGTMVVAQESAGDIFGEKLSRILCTVITILFLVASGVAVIIMVLNGLKWTAAGDDAGARKQARDGLVHAIIGLTIVMLAIYVVSVVVEDSDVPMLSCGFPVWGSSGESGYVYTTGSTWISGGGVTGYAVYRPRYVTTTVEVTPFVIEQPVTTISSLYSYTLALKSGWNLISTPLVLENSRISDVLSGVNYNAIYTWNVTKYRETGEGWSVYTNGVKESAQDIHTIEPDRGYWIDVNEPVTLELTGTKPETPRITPVYEGWNLVGPSVLKSVEIKKTTSGLDYSGVYGYNATAVLKNADDSGWRNFAKADNFAGMKPPMPPGMQESQNLNSGHITQFEPGNGYWLYNNQDENWIIE